MPQNRLFQILFWGALGFAFVMASLPQPPAIPGDPSDKVLHVNGGVKVGHWAAQNQAG